MSHRNRGTSLSGKESRDLIRDYLSALDCPRALSCWILFDSGDSSALVQLVNLDCDPTNYASVKDFREAFAATKFLSKCSDLETGIDKPAVAIEAAVKAELRCTSTNETWRGLLSGTVRSPDVSCIPQVIGKISAILGSVPDWIRSHDLVHDGDDYLIPHGIRDVGWSKGRTTSASGPKLSPYSKYGCRLDVSASALRFALREVRDSPWWGAAALEADAPVSVLKEAFTIAKGNVMLTVPKNAKTDRVICYEPHMNIWLQLKVGRYIRARLKKFGIDLDDQSINQRRAMLGSKTGHLSTVDLKSASDTVALELVYQLLPIDWVCLLEDLRSKYTLWPDGHWKLNQKFSSMGNGFTFELESLLFYAICSSVSENVSVYGDDIVLPTENFERAVQLLSFCGFEVNTSKSYSSGYFRESCGENAYFGYSCTPVYLRELPKTLEDVVKLHNQVLLMSKRWDHFPSWEPWGSLLKKWRKHYPHLLGPMGFGDGHYHVTLDEARPCRAKYWVQGWWFETVSRQYRGGVDSFDGATVRSFAAALCASTGPKRVRSLWDSTLDRRSYRYRKIRVLASFWPEVSWT